jgi:hypothetical protein
MVFLLQYDRSTGRLCRFDAFDDAMRTDAERARLALELENPPGSVEVVVLEAESEEALKRTHRRYFESPTELLTHST